MIEIHHDPEWDSDYVIQVDGTRLYVHGDCTTEWEIDGKKVALPACPIHNEPDWALKGAPILYRHDVDVIERICLHGTGHPDIAYLAFISALYGEQAAATRGVHGCCGCCSETGLGDARSPETTGEGAP